MMQGEPIHGILHSTDAHLGVQIPIFKEGSVTAYTLTEDEIIVITSIQLVTVPGGDCYVLLGPDASLGTGETVERGTFAANGGISVSKLTHAGRPGALPFVIAPAGVVDVKFTGFIQQSKTGLDRPSWKEQIGNAL